MNGVWYFGLYARFAGLFEVWFWGGGRGERERKTCSFSWEFYRDRREEPCRVDAIYSGFSDVLNLMLMFGFGSGGREKRHNLFP
jgi:hypothetical protein